MLIPASLLDDPATRRAYLEAALAAWDSEALLEAVVYAHQLFGWRETVTLAVTRNLVYWLREQGYTWPHLPQNVLLQFWQLCTEGCPPLSPRPIRKNSSQYAWWRGLQRFWDTLRWGGVEIPQLEMPPKPRYALIRPYFSDPEFAQLVAGARAHPEGRLRRLGVAVLYLLGETGLWPREIFALRLEDFHPATRVLRVRGEKARSVTLSKEAAAALQEYLEDRESVASLAPLPSTYLFLRMTPKKGGLGRPLNRDTLDGLLERAMQMAGLDHPRPTGALRWRAVRRYLQQGLSPEEVARRTGVASVLSLKD